MTEIWTDDPDDPGQCRKLLVSILYRNRELLQQSHAYISKQEPMCEALLEGSCDASSRSVLRLETQLRDWRELRKWFVSGESNLKWYCEMLSREVADVRGSVKDWVALPVGAVPLALAIERYRDARAQR